MAGDIITMSGDIITISGDIPTQPYAVGTTLTYTCMFGSSLVGMNTTTCQSDFQWSIREDTLPRCETSKFEFVQRFFCSLLKFSRKVLKFLSLFMKKLFSNT